MNPEDYRAVVRHFDNRPKVVEIATRYRDQHKLAYEIAEEELSGTDEWQLSPQRIETLEKNPETPSSDTRSWNGFCQFTSVSPRALYGE